MILMFSSLREVVVLSKATDIFCPVHLFFIFWHFMVYQGHHTLYQEYVSSIKAVLALFCIHMGTTPSSWQSAAVLHKFTWLVVCPSQTLIPCSLFVQDNVYFLCDMSVKSNFTFDLIF